MADLLPPERWHEYGIIDPEMEKVLKEKPLPSLGSFGNAAGLRKGMTDMIMAAVAQFPTPDFTGVHQENIEIPMRDGHKIRGLHVRPSEPKQDGPLLVLYHGGGWVGGSPEYTLMEQAQLAQQAGVASVSVDYRKAPEYKFPYAPNDAWDAFKWCVQNAKQLHGDPSKGLLVGGASAGGNLAAIVALLARDDGTLPTITGVTLNCAALCHSEAYPEKYKKHLSAYEQNANAPVLDRAAMDYFFGEYQPDPKSHLMSPLLWPNGHKDHPPTYFMVMGQDPLRDEALLYEKMLREDYGVKTKIDVFPGLFHTFVGFRPETSHTVKVFAKSADGMGWLLSGAA